MKLNLQFDFLVDKEKNTITLRREFAAPRQLVWDAHTKSELLDQWFAPRPLTTRTKTMDFRDGGHWHYAMVEPSGTEYWGRLDYIKIKPIDHYTALDAFSDANGSINPHMPRAHWDVTFQDLAKHALVQTIVTYNSLNELESVIKMNMQEGMISTLGRLDDLLLTLTK